MTYIYGLFVGEECYYIGQTKREPTVRFKEHKRDISKGVHSIKALNKVNSDEVQGRVLLTLNSDNTLLLCFAECLMNSIYKPRNKCVLQQGYNKVVLQRCDKELAERLLECIRG